MRPFITCLLCSIAFLGFSQVADAALVITEVMYKPSGTNGGTTGSDEWFEIFNSGSGTVDLGTIKFDDDSNASDGVFLSSVPTSLAVGQYAIVANKNQAGWEARYGTKPSSALFLQPSGNWNPLDDNSDTMSLYNTVTGLSVFSMTYNNIAIPSGVSIYFSGTNPALIGNPNTFLNQPGAWQKSPTNLGPATDKHSGGSGSIQTQSAPEPAAWAMMGIAAIGLVIVISRRPTVRSA